MSGRSFLFTVYELDTQKILGCECHRVSHPYAERLLATSVVKQRIRGKEYAIVAVERSKAECKKARKQILNDNNILNVKEFHDYIIGLIVGGKK